MNTKVNTLRLQGPFVRILQVTWLNRAISRGLIMRLHDSKQREIFVSFRHNFFTKFRSDSFTIYKNTDSWTWIVDFFSWFRTEYKMLKEIVQEGLKKFKNSLFFSVFLLTIKIWVMSLPLNMYFCNFIMIG